MIQPRIQQHNKSPMSSLRSFIKSVRKAKTIADERLAVRKELAAIRTAFRDAQLDNNSRRINISKLVYLYIIGEKTHFGQVECLKLLASPRFADKRLGYLATLLLLDENHEVLTLLTNLLDNDMQHPNAFIVALALCCLGNVALPELSRDLYTNVDKIIGSSNAYLRKKALFVAAKLVHKDPDLAEVFAPRLQHLVADKLAGPLLGALRLVQSVYEYSPAHRPELVALIPAVVSHLKRVATSGYMPDYDVHGIVDPFLQVLLLSTIRILAQDDPHQYLEQINDILTQVASNDPGKNSAHAVLYECVKTIFAIPSDQSLRILAVNLLGKFLSSKDNNTRYVALDTLLTVVPHEPVAVQRHRQTIVACLNDGDISIRRRALELSFAILNENNIRVLVREILSYLESSPDSDLKPFVTAQLTVAAARYAPNEKWHFDTMIRMLKTAGNYVTADIISNILALIIQCKDTDLKKHIVGRLLSLCLEDDTQFGLAMVCVWVIGEDSDLILGGPIDNSGTESEPSSRGSLIPVTEELILSLLERLVNNTTYSDSETVHLVSYVLTAAIKLSVKFTEPSSIEKLRLIINERTHDNNLEIQVRAVEYQEIFALEPSLKKGLLSKMPPPPVKQREALSLKGTKKSDDTKTVSSGSLNTTEDLLLDLMDEPKAERNNDLLSSIFNKPENGSKTSHSANNAANSASKSANILDLFETKAPAPSSVSVPSVPPAFSNSSIAVAFIPQVTSPGNASIEALVTSNTASPITQFQLMVAVPKSQKLTISSTSGDTLTSENPIVQHLKVSGKEGAKVKFRVKAKYNVGGSFQEEMFDVAGITTL